MYAPKIYCSRIVTTVTLTASISATAEAQQVCKDSHSPIFTAPASSVFFGGEVSTGLLHPPALCQTQQHKAKLRRGKAVCLLRL